MDIFYLLVLRLIKDLQDLSNQLKEMCDVLTESEREANPCHISPSEDREEANDKSS